MTGLPNRSLFNTQLENAIKASDRDNKSLGIVFLDIDSFKHINDIMGHNYGDQLLKMVADKLRTSVRSIDTICRFGGDEFIVMMPQIDLQDDLHKDVNKLIMSFDEPLLIDSQEIFITVSAGVSVYPHDGINGEILIKNADLAMYMAKDRGKNQYAFFSDLMEENIQQKVLLSNQLYRALEKNELVLHYQPQISLTTGRIIGMEALLRWQHPQKGLIPPLVFIPLAESTGLINSIGLWALQTACRQNKIWHGQGHDDLRIAVNISAGQLRKPDFAASVRSVLAQTGLEPDYLELEITEIVFVKEPEHANQALRELKALGVRISIDDFGMEYSSLNRLKEMPVDRLKIDMQFVQGLDKDPKDKAIVNVIISLSQQLGLGVTAEGVETRPQLNHLIGQGCDEVQGYYFSKPLPVTDVDRILQLDFEKALNCVTRHMN